MTRTGRCESKLVYRVKPGDTLASIARVFKTTVASLKKWNSLRGNSIRAGERLTIFTTAPTTSATH
jgi:membrane-bound lytic murein transglycosylase D